MCVMIKDKKTGGWPSFGLFSDEGLKRAKKHLEYLGIRWDKIPPFDPPDDAVSASRDSNLGDYYAPWVYTTKSDILREKRERRERHLAYVRELEENNIVRRRPLYVWVFWCPGVSGFFEGWWTYIIGRGIEHGGKCCKDSNLILRAMELFPIIEGTLFGIGEDWEERERWMKEFAKRYQRGCWCGKPQGKALIWANVKGSNIERILGRAEWPKRKESLNDDPILDNKRS